MNDEDVLYFYQVRYLVSDRLTVWSNLIHLFIVEYIKKTFLSNTYYSIDYGD